MSIKRSLVFVTLWVSSALAFAYGVFHFYGPKFGMEFLTCYAIEWSLSLDNLFVFLMIFRAFGVDGHRQLRALKWGIIGAIIMRLIFIVIGVALVEAFEPILYAFGVLLIYSAFHMVTAKEGEGEVHNNKLVKFVRSRMPVTKHFVKDKFFIRRRGALIATPLLLVLVAIESSDLMFAIDSIPAAFAISREPMIIFSANVFAIMGLRSLFFLLAHADRLFWLLKYGIGLILTFVGLKMITFKWIHVDENISLGIILGTLIMTILFSLIIRKPGVKS